MRQKSDRPVNGPAMTAKLIVYLFRKNAGTKRIVRQLRGFFKLAIRKHLQDFCAYLRRIGQKRGKEGPPWTNAARNREAGTNKGQNITRLHLRRQRPKTVQT